MNTDKRKKARQSGWRCTGWTVNGATVTDNPYTFTLSGNVTAQACYAGDINLFEDVV